MICGLPDARGVLRQLRQDHLGGYLVLGGGRFAGRLRRVVHAAKYRQDPAALALLARQATLALPAGLGWDALVPVPAHAVRVRERGGETTGALAARIGEMCRLPVVRLLVRRKYTRTLTGRCRAERQEIVRAAFQARPAAGRLLVVDDVATSGATFRACRAVLLSAGARSVDLLVVAVTQPMLRRSVARPRAL